MKPLHWNKLNAKKSKGTVFENLDDETMIPMSLFEDSLVEMFRQPPKKPKKPKNHGEKCGETGPVKTGTMNVEIPADVSEKDLKEIENDLAQTHANSLGCKPEQIKFTVDLETGIATYVVKREKKKKKKKGKIVKFADAKKSDKVERVLIKFKLDPGLTRKRVLMMDEENINLAQVQVLIPILPTEEEITLTDAKFLEYGTIDRWGSVEKFLYHFSDLDHAKGRLQSWEFKMSFDEYMMDVEEKLTMIFESYDTITGNTRLQIIFTIIMRVGNYMNGGTSKGQSFGFNLDLLDKLEGTKNIDGQSNLLMYITEFTQKNFPDAMQWEDDFECIVQSSRHEIPDIEKEVRAINEKVSHLEHVIHEIKEEKEKEEAEKKKAKKEANKTEKTNEEELKDKDEAKAPEDLEKKEEEDEEEDNFLSNMEKFKEEYSTRVKKLNDDMELLSETIVKTNKKFAEKPDKTWNEFAKIFKNFRATWIKSREAVQARKDKEEKEMKKKNKKKKLEKKLKNRPRRQTLVDNGQIKEKSQIKKNKAAKLKALELLQQMIEKATRSERKKGSRHMSFAATKELHYLCNHCGLRFKSSLQISGLYFHKCWDDVDSMKLNQPKKNVELSINSNNDKCSFGHRGFCLRPSLPDQAGFSQKKKTKEEKKKKKEREGKTTQKLLNNRRKFCSTLSIPSSYLGNRSKSFAIWSYAKKKGFNLGALQQPKPFDLSQLGQETILSTTKKRGKKKKKKSGNRSYMVAGLEKRKRKRKKKLRRKTNFDTGSVEDKARASIGSNASPNLKAIKKEAEEGGERKISDVEVLPPAQEKKFVTSRSVRFSNVDEQQDVDGSTVNISKIIRKVSKGNAEQTTNMSARMSRSNSKNKIEKFVTTPMKITRIKSNGDEKQRYIFVADQQFWWVKQLSEAEATLNGNPPTKLFGTTTNSIPVRSIANVISGCQSTGFLSFVESKDHDQKCCFSIITKEMELDFLCKAKGEKTKWVSHLQRYQKNLLKADKKEDKVQN